MVKDVGCAISAQKCRRSGERNNRHAEREGRLRAEEALGQRQNLLQAIIDYAPQAITVQDLVEGRHLLANRRQAASLAGLAFTRLTEAIPARRTRDPDHPEYRHRHRACRTPYARRTAAPRRCRPLPGERARADTVRCREVHRPPEAYAIGPLREPPAPPTDNCATGTSEHSPLDAATAQPPPMGYHWDEDCRSPPFVVAADTAG